MGTHKWMPLYFIPQTCREQCSSGVGNMVVREKIIVVFKILQMNWINRMNMYYKRGLTRSAYKIQARLPNARLPQNADREISSCLVFENGCSEVLVWPQKPIGFFKNWWSSTHVGTLKKLGSGISQRWQPEQKEWKDAFTKKKPRQANRVQLSPRTSSPWTTRWCFPLWKRVPPHS